MKNIKFKIFIFILLLTCAKENKLFCNNVKEIYEKACNVLSAYLPKILDFCKNKLSYYENLKKFRELLYSKNSTFITYEKIYKEKLEACNKIDFEFSHRKTPGSKAVQKVIQSIDLKIASNTEELKELIELLTKRLS